MKSRAASSNRVRNEKNEKVTLQTNRTKSSLKSSGLEEMLSIIRIDQICFTANHKERECDVESLSLHFLCLFKPIAQTMRTIFLRKIDSNGNNKLDMVKKKERATMLPDSAVCFEPNQL